MSAYGVTSRTPRCEECTQPLHTRAWRDAGGGRGLHLDCELAGRRGELQAGIQWLRETLLALRNLSDAAIDVGKAAVAVANDSTADVERVDEALIRVNAVRVQLRKMSRLP